MLRDLVREVGAEEIAGLLRAAGGPRGSWPGCCPSSPGQPRPGTATAADGQRRARDRWRGRAQLFEGFLTLLERLAEQRPLVLVIEDAHWADRSSRDLLAFLIGYQRALRGVLIVVTFRSDELHRTHPLRPLLAELARIDWVERADCPG